MKTETQLKFDAIDEKSFVDVPASQPEIKFALPKVGITNRPIYLNVLDPFSNENGPVTLFGDIKIFFSLPAKQRGLHMSRIEECLHEIALEKDLSINRWLEKLTNQLIEKQKQSNCYVELNAPYHNPIDKNISGRRSIELIKLHSSLNIKDKKIDTARGITVPFINACPCTQRWAMRDFFNALIHSGYDSESAEKLIRIAPLQAHTNLGHAMLTVHSSKINHDKIYRVLEKALPIVRELLKGMDEHNVVKTAHQQGQFCEDNTRSIIRSVCHELDGSIDDDSLIEIKVEVNESVHFHNLYCEISSSFGQLKANLPS